MMNHSEVVFFKHRVGDGVHYVNHNARTFPDGTSQLGDTSEGCILVILEIILNRNNIDASIDQIWNATYPHDLMSDTDLAYILFTSVAYMADFDPTAPENIADAIEDARKMGCPELAERFQEILRNGKTTRGRK